MTYLDTDWSLVDFSDPKPAVKEPQAVEKGTCQKCGKHVGKGAYAHIKACKGAK